MIENENTDPKNQPHRLANYVGELQNGRMTGQGTYWFDTHTRYEGEFKDGMFHGKGNLHFTNGGRYEANWLCGREVGVGHYIFDDGLEFEENGDTLTGWRYGNRVWDRRFYKEITGGLRPVDKCLVVPDCDINGKPLRQIPQSCYDVGDGFYDPYSRIVYKYFEETETDSEDKNSQASSSISSEKPRSFIRNVTAQEHDWIVTFCRSGCDDFVCCQRVTNYDDVIAMSDRVGLGAKRKMGNFTSNGNITKPKEASSSKAVNKKVRFGEVAN
ncbi:MORN repeat-containing protein 5-like [Ciona intestinalis]